MIAALRSEWVKLRTIRMNWVLVIIAFTFPLVVTILVMALSDIEELNATDTVGGIAGFSVITAMLLGVVGAATITSEFGFGTIRVTFAAEPRRWVVLVAKAIVTVVVSAVLAAITIGTCWLAASLIASTRDSPLELSENAAGAAPLYGVIALAAIVSLFGYGLGLLVRLTPVAVAILILWPLVAEPIIGAVLGLTGIDDPLKWMPYQSGIGMVVNDLDDVDSFGRVGGGLYFLAVAALIGFVGAWFTSRRDA